MGAVSFSIDPRIVRELTTTLGLSVFVETGTYEGASVRSVLPLFREIHTVEVSEDLYRRAVEDFASSHHVSVHLGRSPGVLADLAADLREEAVLFWLDAHCCGGAGLDEAEPQCPLLEELEAIRALNDRSVVMIDDARLFLAPPPAPAKAEEWPDFGEVLVRLRTLSSEHDLMVIDDVIVFFPRFVKPTLVRYAQNHAVDWLDQGERSRQLERRLDGLASQVKAANRGVRALREGNKTQQAALSRTRDEVRSLENKLRGVRAEHQRQLEAVGREVKALRAAQDAHLGWRRRMRSIVLGVSSWSSGGHLAQPGSLRLRRALSGPRVLAASAVRVGRLGRRKAVSGARRGRARAVRVGRLGRRKAVRGARRGRARTVRLSRLTKRTVVRSLFATKRRWRLMMRPGLGRLHHHSPKPLVISQRYVPTLVPDDGPVISIVTPSYNHAPFLERTIRSVLEQGYPRLEYVVQDGGSTDGTNAILGRYSDQLHRCEMRPDRGQAHAINLGFAHTTGEVMAYVNSDDLLLPGTLAYVAQYFNQNEHVDAVYGHRILIDEQDMEVGRWVLPRHDGAVLSWADYVPQETLFWRRRIWEAAGGRMDEQFQFALDWDLLLRFRAAGARIVRLPRFLGAFRVHPSQKSSAHIDTKGRQEVARIRAREHGRDVSKDEVLQEIRGYLRRHVLLDRLYGLGLLRY